MRIAVLVLGILGVMGPAFLGIISQEQISKKQKDLDFARKIFAETGAHKDPKIRQGLKDADQFIQTSYLWLAAIPLGLFGAVLGFLGRPLSASLLMIIPALCPALLAPEMNMKLLSLGFSSLLLIGGILAFLVRPPKPKTPREMVEGEEMEDEDEPPRPVTRKAAKAQEKITKKPARKQVVEDDDEDEEEEAPRPRRRRKDEEDD